MKQEKWPIGKLKICTFNVENLFISNAKEPAHALEKSQEKIRWLAEIIREIDADIYFLCEVGGESSLQSFNQYYLKDQFHTLLIPGNSDRGIEIAYLIKKDLGLYFEQYSHKNRPIDFWNKKELEENEKRKIEKVEIIPSQKFSRDVAELRLFAKKEDCTHPPLLTLFGVHLKSKLDPEGLDFEGRGKRAQETLTLRKIAKTMYLHWQKKCPIIILGDFNGPALRESFDPEFKSFWPGNKTLNYRDILELKGQKIEDRTTFISVPHPTKNIPVRKQQLDYIFLSSELHSLCDLEGSGIYHFKSQNIEIPYPSTLPEKYALPSDHYPVFVTLKMKS